MYKTLNSEFQWCTDGNMQTLSRYIKYALHFTFYTNNIWKNLVIYTDHIIMLGQLNEGDYDG